MPLRDLLNLIQSGSLTAAKISTLVILEVVSVLDPF